MNILKLSITISALILANSSLANARTKGNYFEISAINTSVRFKYDYQDSVKSVANNTSLGVKYSYAFNYKNLYIAPGIFYDHHNVTQNSPNHYLGNDGKFYDSGDRSRNFVNNYGIKLNIGYDTTYRFSTFVTLGYGNSRYLTGRHTFIAGTADERAESSYIVETYIAGLGAKYSLFKNIDVLASYELGTASAASARSLTTRCAKSTSEIANI